MNFVGREMISEVIAAALPPTRIYNALEETFSVIH